MMVSEFNGYSLQEFVFVCHRYLLSKTLLKLDNQSFCLFDFRIQYHSTNRVGRNIEDGREHDLIHYTVCGGSVCECLHCEGMYSTCIRWQHIRHSMI